jgi:hypothetical protein
MEILEMTVKIKLHKPEEGDLPTKYGNYYTIDIYDNHQILTYNPSMYNNNWSTYLGTTIIKNNNEIKYWTEL